MAQVFNLANPVDAVWIRRYLCEGGIVACAAEGVWGLSCDPGNPAAVMALNKIKGREQGKGYILVSGQRRHFDNIESRLENTQRALLDKHWPGATSFVFPDPDCLYPSWVTANATPGGSVVLRHTSHPQLAALSELLGSSVVSTSANPAGKPPASCAKEVAAYFGTGLVMVQSEVVSPGCVSAIIDLSSNKKIR